MYSLKKQRGLSAIGWLFFITLFGFSLLVVSKLGPHYMDNRLVVSTLKTLADDPGFSRMTVREVKEKLRKTFTVNNVRGTPVKALRVVKTGDNIVASVVYEERMNLLLNIDVVLTFNSELDSKYPRRCCRPIKREKVNARF